MLERARFYLGDFRQSTGERLARFGSWRKSLEIPYLGDMKGLAKEKLFGIYYFDEPDFDPEGRVRISDVEEERSTEIIKKYPGGVGDIAKAARNARIMGAASTAASRILLLGGAFLPIFTGQFNGYESTSEGLAIMASYYTGLIMASYGLRETGAQLHHENHYMRLAMDRIENPGKYASVVIIRHKEMLEEQPED